ncbi:MAG: 4Fe-4S ferredoxin [Promethearchaeota archaeon]
MEEIKQLLNKIIKSLLSEGKVEYVLGFEEGTLPLKSGPLYIEKEEDLDKLIWNDYCNLNLVKFLLEESPGKKVGIILKNCEIRTLIVLINEKQIKREDVVIIGVPCNYGIIDSNKVSKIIGGKDILEFDKVGDDYIFKGIDFEQKININDILSDSCKFCKDKNPVEYDYLIDTPKEWKSSKEEDFDEYADLIEFEKKTPKERWAYFKKELEKCTLCMACRNACPLCYCKECFIDLNQPQWFDKTDDLSEIILFHMTRALHLAGRCTGCDACTRACPEGIDIHLIYKKMRKSVKDRWKVDKIELGDPSVMGSYRIDDPQEFIVKED